MSESEENLENADAGTEGAPASEAPHARASESDATSEPAGLDEVSAGTQVAAEPGGEPAAEPVAEAEPADEPAPAEAPEPTAAAEKPSKAAASTPAAKKPATGGRKRGGRGRDSEAVAPVVRAQAKYVRSSARKARLVCDNIRGKTVEEARAILALTPRAVARDWSKLLESAVANAEHNHELVGEDLFVKAVTADEGPTIKRFRPRAMGRATKIRKRTAHLTILLTPRD